MKQTPEPEEAFEIDSLIQECLAGEFHREKNEYGFIDSTADYTVRRLSTAIDDPALIANLLQPLLREELEKSYLEDQRHEIGDRQFSPVTEEFAGANIFKHPDAKTALISILSQAEGGIIDELLVRGEINEEEIEEISEKLITSDGEQIDSLAAVQLEKKAGKYGDCAKQWRLVIESYINTAPDRDYREEYLRKAHGRWIEGVVTNWDLVHGFRDMVDFTADPKLITLLVTEILKKGQNRAIPPTLEELRKVLLTFSKQEDGQAHQNSAFWLRTVEEMIRRQ